MSSAGNVSTSSSILVVGIPSRRKRRFSSSRSCEASSATGPGIAPTRRRLDRDVLELVRDGGSALGQPVEQGGIVVGADEQLSHLPAGAAAKRVEKAEGQAEGIPASASMRPSWPPPMTATSTPTRPYAAGSGAASTEAVCAAR